jgi:hypothetical protein
MLFNFMWTLKMYITMMENNRGNNSNKLTLVVLVQTVCNEIEGMYGQFRGRENHTPPCS